MPISKKYTPLLLGLAVAIGVLIGGKLSFSDASDRLFTSNSKKDKLNRLIDYIDLEYVDEVNTDSIVDVTVNGILDNLDPHSTYIPQKDLQRMTENLQGDFVGIGVSYYTYKDTIAVIKPTPGGPSEAAGIIGGDRIVIADGDSIFGSQLTTADIVSKLKGEKNTKVNLKVYRKGEPELLEFRIKRTDIPIRSVDAAYMLTDNLGYIKINKFAETTYKEFKVALTSLQKKGATQLALDLRDNLGGFLTIAEQIVDEFLPDDTLILFTKNKKGTIEKSYATKKGDFESGRVFVLINENSASASEIVAGALQDNDKGTIVGRRSYGKGLVQREMSLGDGSAVRLTVSRYYTPTGRSIQRPYTNGENDTYYKDYYKRLRDGEFTNEDKIQVDDSLKFTTPKGKIVYGGGGIIPDVFVPLDTSVQNETLTYIERRGYINYFVFEELEKNRNAFAGMTKDAFVNDYSVSNEMVIKFQDYLNLRERTKITFAAYYSQMKLMIKAAFADQLFTRNEYEQIINTSDVMVDEVVVLSQE